MRQSKFDELMQQVRDFTSEHGFDSDTTKKFIQNILTTTDLTPGQAADISIYVSPLDHLSVY